MNSKFFSVFCQSSLLCLFLAIALLNSGCGLYNRFKPNTMLKEFVVDGDTPKVGGYEMTVLMQAKEVGNKIGVDDYRIVLQLKSDKAVNSSDDSLALAIPRFDSLTITSDDEPAFRVELGKDRLSYHDLNTRPQIFRNHYLEYFDIRNVHIPDQINKIKLEARTQLFDRRTHQNTGTEMVSVYLEKRQSIEWYDPSRLEQQDELQGLESYRGTTSDD